MARPLPGPKGNRFVNITPMQMPVVDYCDALKSHAIYINRDYQRSDKVWPPAARSFLIETMLLGYPIPKLLLSQHTDLRTRKSRKEIVDGQQRSATVLSYFEGEFGISKHSTVERLAGRKLEDLDEDDRRRFLDYGLGIDLVVAATPDEIRETFRRINSYTVPLNPEEQRHAVHQGSFKWFIYNLTKKFEQSFLQIGLFNQKALVRMRDAKLLCEIIHAMLNGIVTTNKNHLDGLYRSRNDAFPEHVHVDRRLCGAMDFLLDQPDIHNGPLMKPHLVYSLILAAVQVAEPLAELASVFGGQGRPIDRRGASIHLGRLADALEQDGGEGELRRFVAASSSRTNVAGQRQVRTQYFCRALTGGNLE